MSAQRYFLTAVILSTAFLEGCLEPPARVSPPPRASNSRLFAGPCQAVWPAALKTLTSEGFRLMANDARGGVASFLWADERRLGRLRATGDLEQFIVAQNGFLKEFRDARVESAVLELRPAERGCQASLQVSFAAKPGALGLKRGWIRLESTGQFEQSLLARVAAAAGAPARRAAAKPAPAAPGAPPATAGVIVAGLWSEADPRWAPAGEAAETRVMRLGISH